MTGANGERESRLYRWVAGVVVPILVAAIAAGAWQLLDRQDNETNNETAGPSTKASSTGPSTLGPDRTPRTFSPPLPPLPRPDPERYSPAPTRWWYQLTNKAGVDVLLNQNHARVIDVGPDRGDSFAVVSVDNRNSAYVRTPGESSSWATGETLQSLTSKIDSGRRRLIDIERYTVAGQTRFAAAWVDNTGAAAKTWYWWLGLTPDEIATKINACACRLVDIDPVGGGRYDVIMIVGTGVDGLAWWWYVGVGQPQVSLYLTANRARAVDLEPDGSGRFAVIMVRDSVSGSVKFDQSWEAIGQPLSGRRYVHIRRYTNTAGANVWLSVDIKTT